MELRDIIGIPYKKHGNDLTGLDCNGCLNLAYEICTGKKLNGEYKKIEKPEKYCILVFDKGRHCGLYLGHGEFIHCDSNGVNIAQLHNWECRISGVYKA